MASFTVDLILLGSALLLSVAGVLLLPKRMKFSRSGLFRAPPEQVWILISDFPGTVRWRAEIASVSRMAGPHGEEIWKEIDKRGAIGRFRVVNEIPGEKLVREIMDCEKGRLGTFSFELSRRAGGCSELKVTRNLELKNPWARVRCRFFENHGKLLERYLADMKKTLGEVRT